ncbi:RTA1 like domain-containing protein [Trichoderma velutinum]
MTSTSVSVASITLVERALSACTTAVPGQYGEVPVGSCNSSYQAIPQFVPALITAIIFGVLTLIHFIEAIVFRKLYAWVIIMGGAWETGAFVLHTFRAHDQQNIEFATVWQVLFLLAPLWINAFVYMTFSRMVHFFPREKKLFVWADILSFIMQATGGIMPSPGIPPTVEKLGLNLYEAGIGVQEFFIVCFLMLMIVFHRRNLQLARARNIHLEDIDMDNHLDMGRYPKKGWEKLLYSLYAVLGFISIRIIYRLVEFTRGDDPSINPIPYNEAYSYTLDALPMMISLLIVAIFHPGRVLQRPDARYRRENEGTKEARESR